MTRDIKVRPKAPALGIERTIEQHGLNAVMVMEVLDVAHMGHAQPDMGVQIRGAVR